MTSLIDAKGARPTNICLPRIVAIVVGFSGGLLFLFVPETHWDRTPIPRSRRRPKRPSLFSRRSASRYSVPKVTKPAKEPAPDEVAATPGISSPVEEKGAHDLQEKTGQSAVAPTRHKSGHVGFAPDTNVDASSEVKQEGKEPKSLEKELSDEKIDAEDQLERVNQPLEPQPPKPPSRPASGRHVSYGNAGSRRASMMLESPPPATPDTNREGQPSESYFRDPDIGVPQHAHEMLSDTESEKLSISNMPSATRGQLYTHALRQAPPKSFSQQLKLHNGRLNQDKWWKVALRPFILFSYPAVLWSSAIYACSVGWLIVISESVAVIYQQGIYKFNALQTGLVYISPFVGGILGTAVAGKVSDVIVKAMARRNGGLYEPEFRLVMAIPIAITTVIGLIGFGWSAHIADPWIVPTLFFGVVSFGCSLGSTTSITFCVDSYRQYAGEALVTLNLSKNVLHGFIFSLFVTEWLVHDGSKSVFMWIGIIQLIILISTIPMYIYGKRARMVRSQSPSFPFLACLKSSLSLAIPFCWA